MSGEFLQIQDVSQMPVISRDAPPAAEGSPTAALVSLGCAKNAVDSEIMLASLVRAGYRLVADAGEANVAIVNTCGFIEDAKRESIDTILGLAGLKEEGLLETRSWRGASPSATGGSWPRAFPRWTCSSAPANTTASGTSSPRHPAAPCPRARPSRTP